MAGIELTDIHKSYGPTRVVQGLSLSIGQGEFLALLGPSGCGKTTTLRMIAGLEVPDSGTIAIDGRVVHGPGARVPPERRGLGMVFQSYAVWPHRTVAKNVEYPLRLMGLRRAEATARVREALGWVRMEALAERMPHALSGGQLQRVALARALVGRPRVLLLDEPLSNLDAALKEELRAEIAALRSRLGTTMVYVTHDQGEAMALADRIAVMDSGRLEQVDSPERLYSEPATPFVAGFVGGANLLGGESGAGCFFASGAKFELPPELSGAEGPGTLVVRPEDLEVGVGQGGTPLTLSARLFLGSSAEYRFPLGDRLLRAIGPPLEARPGETLPVRVRKGRLFRGSFPATKPGR